MFIHTLCNEIMLEVTSTTAVFTIAVFVTVVMIS